MIKLIAIDLDGTLLNDKKELPADFHEVAETLLQRDVNIVIASGRPFHNVAEVFKDLKDDLYFACDNGTYVTHQGEELLVNPLDRKSMQQFIEISRSLKNVYPVMCGKNLAFIEDEDPEFMKHALKYYQEFKVVDDLTAVKETVLKISLCDLADAEANTYPHFRKFEHDYSIVVSGKIWLDITDKTGNKGNALQKIQGILDVDPDETLVFGDYLNDMSMFERAKYSYAMKNAHPELIAAAAYTTNLDNNEYGVIDTIRELMRL